MALIIGIAVVAAACAYGLWGWTGVLAVLVGLMLGSAIAARDQRDPK